MENRSRVSIKIIKLFYDLVARKAMGNNTMQKNLSEKLGQDHHLTYTKDNCIHGLSFKDVTLSFCLNWLFKEISFKQKLQVMAIM